MKKIIPIFVLILIVVSCRVSYQFNGASVDYSKVKTMEIRQFQNQALDVYPQLAQVFNERLQDVFTRNTKLNFVTNQVADLELEGEITGYNFMPMAVKEDGYANQTRLTITVKIRFRNNVNPNEDKEETFSAYRDFQSDVILSEIRDGLIEELTKDLVDQIFNATLSNW